ncbi:MAG: peptide transporter substrate-binding protein [Dehalococcoidia bacterium]|nr:peptide transporter substrate-binding protein [Dehalococcoidia bacterium]
MLGVGLACAGEEATPTSAPTATLAPAATATTAPTATLVPTATATLVPGAPTPTATLVPTATAIPTVTATAAPTATPRQSAATLTQLPGYKPAWGQPQRGGIMKTGIPNPLSNVRPVTYSSGNETQITPLYNALVKYDPWAATSSLIGDLAKSWEFSGDGLSLTFKLEERVKFQDNPVVPADIRGGDFTCEDVQASVEYTVRPPEPKRAPKATLQHVTGVSCPDGAQGYTAVVNLSQMLARTLGVFFTMPMLDKGWIDWYVANHFDEMGTGSPASFKLAMGTGAFVPLEFQVDVVAKSRRNPSYFREGLPLLDGIDAFILKDFTTRFTALATGQINWLGGASSALLPGQVTQAERDFPDRIVVHMGLHNWGSGLWLNLNRVPFNDRRVRQAIELALDRNDWQLFQMYGSRSGAMLTGYNGPYPAFWWGTPEEVLKTWPGYRQPKDQDIAEANRLLDEVFGKGKRFSTTCLTRNTQNFMNYCLFFKDQMKKNLGIEVSMQPVEVAVMSTYTDACNFDIQGMNLRGGEGDPDDRLVQYSRAYPQSSAEKCKLEGITAAEPALQAEIQAMIEAQSGEFDQVKRAEMVRAIDKKLTLELIDSSPFGWIMIFNGTTPDLKGYTLTATPVMMTQTIFERVWLAK